MKSTLNFKLLQHLIAKKEEGGFTLIELLVVIIIIGILAAIALPSFLNQANRARQSEAVTYIGSINRAQQAYRLENPSFANEIPLLGLGIQQNTKFYNYTTPEAAGGNIANSVRSRAVPTDPALLGYAGVTYTLLDAGGNSTTTAQLCKGGPNVAPTPAVTNAGAANATLGTSCP